MNIFSSQNNQTRSGRVDHGFNQMIETFCGILVLYRELFVDEDSREGDSQVHQRNAPETIFKSLLNPKEGDQAPDSAKIELVCQKLISKLFRLEKIEEKHSLKSHLKKQIGQLSEFVTFFFDEMRVFHGKIAEYQKGGEGHLLDLKNNFEYCGRVKQGVPAGKGQKWVPSAFSVQGYFDQGMLCGFGQKAYFDGSLYRYSDQLGCASRVANPQRRFPHG